MTRDEMIDWVVSKIDEVRPMGANQQGETIVEAPINFIDEELDNSIRYVLQSAPDDMVMPTIKLGEYHNDAGSVPSRLIIGADNVAKYVLPTDFLRFIEIKLTSWARSVAELMDYKDPKYILQTNRTRKGTPRKPVAVLKPFTTYVANEIIVDEPNVHYCLELFSANDGTDTVEYFHYVPVTAVEDLPTNLTDPVAWVCASRALQILKLNDEADLAMKRAEMQLNLFKIGKEGDRFRKTTSN